ncbi:MAG: hypothetical protein Ct9H90mP15_09040 [Candidatus Neomarinimicrobiota bacterium]|nr:MAG: hypothetical protein Ct9H90mP15_09040 [Candidatus Neomarinimicrobiota bacterium]
MRIKAVWIDSSDDEELFAKDFSSFGTYSIDNDPSSDGLDNDNEV